MRLVLIFLVLFMMSGKEGLSYPTKHSSSYEITYKVDLNCDSGWCEGKECSVTITDEFENQRGSVFHDGQRDFPRLCQALKNGESLTLTYTYGRSGAGVCTQNRLSSMGRRLISIDPSDCMVGK